VSEQQLRLALVSSVFVKPYHTPHHLGQSQKSAKNRLITFGSARQTRNAEPRSVARARAWVQYQDVGVVLGAGHNAQWGARRCGRRRKEKGTVAVELLGVVAQRET